MWLSPKTRSCTADLLRLVAGWVAIVLLLQGFAASHARALGPAHHHVASRPGLQLRSHGSPAAQRHEHQKAERHHHDAHDQSVQRHAAQDASDQAWDAAAAALVVALALLAFTKGMRLFAPGQAVWRTTPGWACLTAPHAPPLKPPQPA